MVSFTLAYSGRDVTMLKDRSLNLSVNGQSIVIPLDKDQEIYDLPSLSTEETNIFILENDLGASIKVAGVTLQTNKKAKVDIEKIAPNYQLTVTIEAGKDNRTIFFRTKSSLLPELMPMGESAIEGEYTITQEDSAVIYKLDSKGNITWYLAKTEEQTNGSTYQNFQKHITQEGKIFYSYHIVDPEVNTFGVEDYFPGKRVVLNDEMETIPNEAGGVTCLDPEVDWDKDVPGDPIDGKDFILLDENHYITQSLELVSGEILGAEYKNQFILGAVIQEIKDNEVIFEWRSVEHPEMYETAIQSTSVMDYYHPNGMVIDPADENVLVSFKNANAVIKLNRETGEMIWELSGAGDDFALEKPFTDLRGISVDELDNLVVQDGTRMVTLTISGTTIEKQEEISVPQAGSIQNLPVEKGYIVGGGSDTSGGILSWVDQGTQERIFAVYAQQDLNLSTAFFYPSKLDPEDSGFFS